MSVFLNYYKTWSSQFKARSAVLPLNKRKASGSGEWECDVQHDVMLFITSGSLTFPKSNFEA